jgi:hypothetical protein
VLTSDILACNGLVHTINHVLLPLDGDGELERAALANWFRGFN